MRVRILGPSLITPGQHLMRTIIKPPDKAQEEFGLTDVRNRSHRHDVHSRGIEIDRRLATYMAASTGLNRDAPQALAGPNRAVCNNDLSFPSIRVFGWICNLEIALWPGVSYKANLSNRLALN
jgi:hypothetical protein